MNDERVARISAVLKGKKGEGGWAKVSKWLLEAEMAQSHEQQTFQQCKRMQGAFGYLRQQHHVPPHWWNNHHNKGQPKDSMYLLLASHRPSKLKLVTCNMVGKRPASLQRGSMRKGSWVHLYTRPPKASQQLTVKRCHLGKRESCQALHPSKSLDVFARSGSVSLWKYLPVWKKMLCPEGFGGCLQRIFCFPAEGKMYARFFHDYYCSYFCSKCQCLTKLLDTSPSPSSVGKSTLHSFGTEGTPPTLWTSLLW